MSAEYYVIATLHQDRLVYFQRDMITRRGSKKADGPTSHYSSCLEGARHYMTKKSAVSALKNPDSYATIKGVEPFVVVIRAEPVAVIAP